MDKKVLAGKVRRYIYLRNKQKEIEAELDALKSELVMYAKTQPDMKFTSGKTLVSAVDCNKSTVSVKDLQEKFPKIAKQLLRTSQYFRIDVRTSKK